MKIQLTIKSTLFISNLPLCYTVLMFMTFWGVARAQGEMPSIAVGSRAPSLSSAVWIMGDSSKEIKQDKVFVLELTNRYCVPCRLSIKHMTSLTQKYDKDAVFSAVFVNENVPGSPDTSYMHDVRNYVRDLSKQIKYNTFVDVPKQIVQNSWTRAAGFDGNPYVFIVDKNGRIVWIGNPLDRNLDKIIQEVIEGTYKVGSRDTQLEEKKSSSKKIELAYNHNSNDIIAAVGILDSLLTDNPYQKLLNVQKFQFLSALDESKGYAFIHDLLLRDDIDAEIYRELAGAIRVYGIRHKLVNPDWSLAIELCNRAHELDSNLSRTLIWTDELELSSLYAAMEDFDHAIYNYKRTLSTVRSYNPSMMGLIDRLQNEVKECTLRRDIQKFRSMGDYKRALAAFDTLVENNPKNRIRYHLTLFSVLLDKSDTEGYNFAIRYLNEKSPLADFLHEMGGIIIQRFKDGKIKNMNWSLVSQLLSKATSLAIVSRV